MDVVTTHRIDIDTAYVDHVLSGIKPFEVRRNDRAYVAGDYLLMREVGDTGIEDGHWGEPDQADGHSCSRCRTRRYVRARITYVYSGDPRWTDLTPGVVVLGLGGVGIPLPVGGAS